MTEPCDHLESVLETTGVRARLARVYAQSLLAVAKQQGQAEAICEELGAIVSTVLVPNPAVEIYLTSAAISRKQRLPLLAAAFENTSSELLRKFLGVLNHNNRLDLLRPIAASYRQLLDEGAGRIRVQVTTALPMTDAQLASLSELLRNTLSGDPVIDSRVDPEILGGLVVQVGDRVFDTSVRTRLDNLRNHLMTSGTNV